jgi:protein arginine N-methyltransferase 2
MTRASKFPDPTTTFDPSDHSLSLTFTKQITVHKMDDPAFNTETDLQTQSILLAAANHDTASLRNLLRNSSANVQDSETGFTPLHAAIAACEPDESDAKQTNGKSNGDADNVSGDSEEMDGAVKTVKFLFENGAIWNDLDSNGETPGCIAYRLGLKELYELCVDAGVRAEMLLSRLEQYQLLGDGDSDEEDEEEEEQQQQGEEETRVQEATEGVETVEKATSQPRIRTILLRSLHLIATDY